MRKPVAIVILTAGLLMIPFPIHAEVYKWIDEKGTIHFTDDYCKVPSFYHDRFKAEIRKDIQEEKISVETRKIIPRLREEETKADIRRQEEAWGREKIRPWVEQLKEAKTNYEEAQKKFWEKSEEMSRRRFGSPTMYKFDIIKLDRLNEERMKYEAQISEIDEMLKKLSKQYFLGATSIRGEEIETDIYGIGENWWRERVKHWKENLKQLNASHQNVMEAFVGKATELSRRRYGNRHTIKANIIELDRINKEVIKYQEKITENEKMLKIISKDAEESKANPEWLK